jgi:hypothetical protein
MTEKKGRPESIDSVVEGNLGRWTNYVENMSEKLGYVATAIRDESYSAVNSYIKSKEKLEQKDATSALCIYIINALKQAGEVDGTSKETAEFYEQKMNGGEDPETFFEILAAEAERSIGLGKNQISSIREQLRSELNKTHASPEAVKAKLSNMFYQVSDQHFRNQGFQIATYNFKWNEFGLFKLPEYRKSEEIKNILGQSMSGYVPFDKYVTEEEIKQNVPFIFGEPLENALENLGMRRNKYSIQGK